MKQTLLSLLAIATFGASTALAQALPVKTYEEGRIFQGNRNTVIPVPEAAEARYSLLSAYKVGRRPWADIVVRRDTAEGTWFLSRTYICDQNIYRELGEGNDPRILSANTRPGQAQAKRLVPGTIEFSIARYACGL